MSDTIVILRRPFSWLKIFQLITGMVCYGLYIHDKNIQSAAVYGAGNDSEAFVRGTFTTTAVVGYPFIIILLILIAACVSGASLESSVLCFLLNFVGFGMYLTIGGLVAHYCTNYAAESTIKIFAAMSIITSFLFLCDVIIALMQRSRK